MTVELLPIPSQPTRENKNTSSGFIRRSFRRSLGSVRKSRIPQESFLAAETKYPSWEESFVRLREDRRDAAQAASFNSLITACINSTNERLPSLKYSDPDIKDKDLRVRNIGNLIDGLVVYYAEGVAGARRYLEKQHGYEANSLLGQIESIAQNVENDRDRIFYEARDWGEGEIKDAVRVGHKAIKRLKGGIRSRLYDLSSDNFQRPTGKDRFMDESKALLISLGLSAAVDGPALGVAYGVSEAEKKWDLLPDNKYVLMAVIIASYAPYIKALNDQRKENINMLERGGLGLNALSRQVFNNWNFKYGKRVATHLAFLAWAFYKELPYIGGAGHVGNDASSQVVFAASGSLVAAPIIAVENRIIKKTQEGGFPKTKERIKRGRDRMSNIVRNPFRERVDMHKHIVSDET